MLRMTSELYSHNFSGIQNNYRHSFAIIKVQVWYLYVFFSPSSSLLLLLLCSFPFRSYIILQGIYCDLVSKMYSMFLDSRLQNSSKSTNNSNSTTTGRMGRSKRIKSKRRLLWESERGSTNEWNECAEKEKRIHKHTHKHSTPYNTVRQ